VSEACKGGAEADSLHDSIDMNNFALCSVPLHASMIMDNNSPFEEETSGIAND
jgi:hypothetical protein